MVAFLWTLVFVLLSLVQRVVSINHTSIDDIHAVLSAIDKIVTYYKNNYKGLNLDGFFGLRIIEGQLQLLIEEYNSGHHKHIPPDVISKMVILRNSVQQICLAGIEYVQKDDSQYFQKFYRMVSSPWLVMKAHRRLQPSLRWEIPQYRAQLKVNFKETVSDQCMTELLNNSSQGCLISENCAKLMTTRGLSGYGITHQILWSTIGEIMPNCSKSMNKVCFKKGVVNISHFQQEFCTNNFYEMVAVVHVLMHGTVDQGYQDLFLEQQFACPNLGFFEFLKKEYLQQILSWQFPSGCFGDSEADTNDESSDLGAATLRSGYLEQGAKFLQEVQPAVLNRMKVGRKRASGDQVVTVPKDVSPQKYKLASTHSQTLQVAVQHRKKIVLSNTGQKERTHTGRQLLVEKDMVGGCLSHKTGVGAGALVMYLRYLIDPGQIKWTGAHELFLLDTRSLLQADQQLIVQIADGNDAEDDGAAAGEEEDDEENDADEDEGDEYTDEDNNTENTKSNNIVLNGKGENEEDYVIVNPNLQLPQQAIFDVKLDEEEDPNYYDDEGEREKGIIKRRKPATPRAQPAIKNRRKHSGQVLYTASQDQPNYILIFLLSFAPFVLLFLFLLKFIRKRRVHIRYYF